MTRTFLLAALLALSPLIACAQGSPFTNSVFSTQVFTASGQTGATIQLNGLVVPSTVGSSFSVGTLTITGDSLTTATLAVMGSSDNGATFYALPITTVASPGSAPTATVTVTANGIYQVNLAGITHVQFVTSGTFSATSVSVALTASPNGVITRLGASQAYAMARQTYVLEDYLSSADGYGGTDYGYAVAHFCATVGCSTLLWPARLVTTNPNICKVDTTITIPAPVQFDAASCVLQPQIAMSRPYVTLTGCTTTIGSSTVTCASTTGLAVGDAIGGDTLGPANYVSAVTSGTQFSLQLPASKSWLGLLTIGSTAVAGIDNQKDAAVGQTVTGLGIPTSTTISAINYATQQWTLSNSATVGTNSPSDIYLASGTTISGLTLTAVAQNPTILVPPNTDGARRWGGPNIGAALLNVRINDPAYGHGSPGRSLTGVQGIQVYGNDNVVLRDIAINGLIGSGLILGGYVPSITASGFNTVRESNFEDVFIYSSGDINTGQPSVSLMTGYGNGSSTQDEINSNSFHNIRAVYSDAENMVIGSYLHPGTTNGPRLNIFTGDNQMENGTDLTYFGTADTVRILNAGAYNKFASGQWGSGGYAKAAFHVANSVDLTVTSSSLGAAGSAETFNVGLTGGSPTVTYMSAGSGAGASFPVGQYWNGIGAQLFDGASCNPCNVWFSPTAAVNGTGTTVTLASNYTGAASSGTLTVSNGGYYFHLEPSALTQLQTYGDTYADPSSGLLSLLSLSNTSQALHVGTGSLISPPSLTEDYGGTGGITGWGFYNLSLLPSGYGANSPSGNISFNTIYQSTGGKFIPGRVQAYVSVGSGTNPSHQLYLSCGACAGDYYINTQNTDSVGGTFHNLLANTDIVSFGAYGNTQAYSWGMFGSTSWLLRDVTGGNKPVMTVTPSTENVAFYSTFQLGSATATCATSADGGRFNYIAGASGVKDTLQLCAKDATNAYAWRSLY